MIQDDSMQLDGSVTLVDSTVDGFDMDLDDTLSRDGNGSDMGDDESSDKMSVVSEAVGLDTIPATSNTQSSAKAVDSIMGTVDDWELRNDNRNSEVLQHSQKKVTDSENLDQVDSHSPKSSKQLTANSVQPIEKSITTNQLVLESMSLPKKSPAEIEFTRLHRQCYRTIDSDLKKALHRIRELSEDPEVKTLVDKSQLLREVFTSKYVALKPKKKIPKTHGKHPITSEEVKERLKGEEEDDHPWAASSGFRMPNGGLLLRVTDEVSKGKSHHGVGFLSYGSLSMFQNRRGRAFELTEHSNFGSRHRGPLISVSGSPTELFGKGITKGIRHYIERDSTKPSRCTVRITAINGHARIAGGWPILKLKEEIEHYCPERKGILRFFETEYVLLFRIPLDQIVGTYCWEDVKQYMEDNGCDELTWYKDVVVPDFEEHEAARQEGRPVRGRTSCVCCGH